MANETAEGPKPDAQLGNPSSIEPELSIEERELRLLEENETRKLNALQSEQSQPVLAEHQTQEQDRLRQLRAERRANEPLIVRDRRSPHFQKKDHT